MCSFAPLFTHISFRPVALVHHTCTPHLYFTLQLEPKDLSEQLKKSGAAIPTVRYGAVLYATVWYGVVLYGTVWYGAVRNGMVQYCSVRCGMVQYSTVWCSKTRAASCVTHCNPYSCNTLWHPLIHTSRFGPGSRLPSMSPRPSPACHS